MRVKLLMNWDVKAGVESEYSEFIVNEFIPRAKRLGFTDLQFWYTSYGECEQIQASGIVNSREQMNNIIDSDEWQSLQQRLHELVHKFTSKLIPASNGFQI